MKSLVKSSSLVLTGTALIVLVARAQLNDSPPPPDSVVQLTAETQGLNLVAPADLPEDGTFWMVTTNGLMAPWPCPPRNPTMPIYGLADGQFLVDDTGGKIATENQASVADALAALANQVSNLITKVQTYAARQTMRAMGMNVPGPDDGGESGGVFGPTSGPSFPPNTNFLISVQGNNIALAWRSTTNRLFLVEDRPTLTSESQWNELANYYLSAQNTNWTGLVHTNIISLQPINFYRILDVTPVAHDDFFAVNQASTDNQLDIFQNDFCPNDDPIYITNLVTAQHGQISYSSDATTFQYTPNAGFYGVDSFSYAITSGHGEISSNATVSVFVNQSGNSSPAVPDLVFTLPANVYTASFNALTTATDPDGDTKILFSLGVPSMGTVSNDASGVVTYTRNPGLFGNDAFTYIITDGKGGYGLGHVKVLQVDTDGDGMPDQWELANGFDLFNDDSMADSDNDGLPNLGEFTLRTNPTVADNPLNLFSVTNGMPISGFSKIPIRGLSPSISMPPLSLCVGSNLAEHAFISQGPDGQWLVNWDTTFLPNGSYQIQLACQVAPPSSPDSIANILGEPKTVEVFNPIRFDSFTSKFSSFLLIYATMAVPNSTYDIYLNDENGNPLVNASGISAPDGNIALYWDLTDGNGNQISFGDIQAEFDVYPPANNANGPQPNSPTPYTRTQQWFHKDGANSGGAFAVAWGWDSYFTPFNNHREQLMADGVINVLGNPSDFNSYNLLPVANVPYGGSSFRYDSDSDKDILMHAMAHSGNFFWFGHGSSLGIGGNPKLSNIVAGDVENFLQNKSFRSTPKRPTTDKHPYHLVILNACETYSSDWAGAFGIDFSANGSSLTAADYDFAGRPPRALVGWTKRVFLPTAADFSGLAHAQYAQALQTLFGCWMAGYPLDYCMDQFTAVANSYGFTGSNGADSWQISGCIETQRND